MNRYEAKQKALDLITKEYEKAAAEKPPYNSPHEAYAILLEEVEEFWAEVKKKEELHDLDRMAEEVKQIGAVAMRILTDVCLKDKPGKGYYYTPPFL